MYIYMHICHLVYIFIAEYAYTTYVSRLRHIHNSYVNVFECLRQSFPLFLLGSAAMGVVVEL